MWAIRRDNLLNSLTSFFSRKCHIGMDAGSSNLQLILKLSVEGWSTTEATKALMVLAVFPMPRLEFDRRLSLVARKRFVQ